MKVSDAEVGSKVTISAEGIDYFGLDESDTEKYCSQFFTIESVETDDFGFINIKLGGDTLVFDESESEMDLLESA